MIYAFDVDGTITDMWFGEHCPDFYIGAEDAAIKAYKVKNLYEYVKPLKHVLEFMNNIKKYDSNARFVVVTRISNSKEYKDKKNFIKNNFIDEEGNQYFNKNDIYGTVSNEDKKYILNMLAEQSGVIYFDDSLSIINEINTEWVNKLRVESTDNYVLCVHAMSLLTKTVKEILHAYEYFPMSIIWQRG